MALSIDHYQDSLVRDNEITKEMDARYNEYIAPNQIFWREASVDTRFKAGDQRIYADLYGGNVNNRQFFFNKIMRITNMITGFQRQNRKSTTVIGIDSSDDKTAGQHSKSVFWAQKRAGIDQVFSKAFEAGSVTTGLNLIGLRMDFSSDPSSGDIKATNVGYSSFLIDPNFRKQDLSDCNCIWRRVWLTKQQAKLYLPGYAREIEKMQPLGNRDGKFPLQAQSYSLSINTLLPVDEYYYLDSREQTVLMDLNTREAIEFNGEDDDLEKQQFLRQYPEVVERKTYVSTVKQAIKINGRLMYEGPTSLGIDPYPFCALIGYHEPDLPFIGARLQGVVRGLRDAQYLYNRRKVIELDILESQVNSGFKYKVDALVDPNDIYLKGQGKGIALQPGAQMTDVEKIPAADLPPNIIQLSEILGREMMEISGVNEELLGAATDDKAGILAKLRQSAGLITLQKIFDQADASQEHLGRLFLLAIQKNWKAPKVRRVINEEPTPQFFDTAFAKYDCEVVEGVNTSTQRQMALQQAAYLREVLQIPISSNYLLSLASIEDKDKVIEDVENQEKAMQEKEQKREQIELAALQAQINAKEAEALAATGYGLEHLSRVRKNEAEAESSKAQAIERHEQAALDKARAIKEIQEMDLAQIERMLKIYAALEPEKPEQSATIETQGQL